MSIYPAGQCTDWAAIAAPWSVRYGNLGHAKDWAAAWAAQGGAVATTPALGAVACFQPGVDGADATYGHVGVVINVGPDAESFTISEQNGPAGPGRTDDRVCAVVPGVSFLLETASVPEGSDVLTNGQATALAALMDVALYGRLREGDGTPATNELAKVAGQIGSTNGDSVLGDVQTGVTTTEHVERERALHFVVDNLAAIAKAIGVAPPS